MKSYLKDKNLNTGITLFVLLTFISFVLTYNFFIGFFFYADLQFILGALIGVVFTLKNLKSDQSILRYGIITGIGGGGLSSFFIALFEWIIISSIYGINILWFLIRILYLCLTGIPFGLIIGALIGSYYMYKEIKTEDEDEHKKDDFFNHLIEK